MSELTIRTDFLIPKYICISRQSLQLAKVNVFISRSVTSLLEGIVFCLPTDIQFCEDISQMGISLYICLPGSDDYYHELLLSA